MTRIRTKLRAEKLSLFVLIIVIIILIINKVNQVTGVTALDEVCISRYKLSIVIMHRVL